MTAGLLLFKISSRWRSINISVAAYRLEQKLKQSMTRTLCGYCAQLSPTYNIGELDCKWVTVLQQKEKQQFLLQWRKTLFPLLSLVVVQLLYRVDDASPAHMICTKSVKRKIKKGPLMITIIKHIKKVIIKLWGNHTLHPMMPFG